MEGQIVGTCGNCGGAVRIPWPWFSVKAPQPTCEACGSVAAKAFGPTIPMKPKPDWHLPATQQKEGT